VPPWEHRSFQNTRKKGRIMIEQYLRKVQDHGTGKETRIPPEICEGLDITNGDDIEFDLEPGDNIVTLRKAGTSGNRQNEEQPKALAGTISPANEVDDNDETGIEIEISFED